MYDFLLQMHSSFHVIIHQRILSMSQPIYLVVGTNRPNSASKSFARYYQGYLQGLQQHAEILDLADLPKDFAFSALYKNSGKNEVFNTFQTRIDAAEKFIFIVPEYNHSFPGVLKTFLDGLFRSATPRFCGRISTRCAQSVLWFYWSGASPNRARGGWRISAAAAGASCGAGAALAGPELASMKFSTRGRMFRRQLRPAKMP